MGRPLSNDGRDTREELIDAALDVFAEKGFHGASLKEIAAVVGVRDSAIYHYFDSKEALIDAIFAERPKPTAARQRLLTEESLPDARTGLERIGAIIVAQIESPSTQKLFRVLMSDGLRLYAERRLDLLRYFDGRGITKLLERMIREKMLRPASPELLAVEFVAPFHVLMMLRMLQPRHPLARDLDAFVRAHIDQFLKGASRNPT